MRWLALDLGKKCVGAAVCDGSESVTVALPPFSAEELLARVRALVAEFGVEGIVVGVPVTQKGHSRGEVRAEKVVAQLAGLGLPVEREDERGTTAAAETLLRQAAVPRRRWAKEINSLAARLILEAFLDRRRRFGLPPSR